MRECFHGPHAIAVTPVNVLGVLSLVFWALILVISVKYLTFVLQADNKGEGGILALTALATPIKILSKSERWSLVVLGIFGAALLYGDGMITPADFRSLGGRRFERRDPDFCVLRDSNHDCDSHRIVSNTASRHSRDRQNLWSRHAHLFRDAHRAGNRADRAAP
jgi:hypothetical protein